MMNTAWCRISGARAISRSIALLIGAAVFLCGNAVAGTMTVATGGSAISADTTSAAGGTGAWTSLTGPIYQEAVKADLAVGTVILTAPAGFEFNTAATVTVQLTGGNANANQNINKTAVGGTVATATVTANTITWNVTFQSAGNTMDQVTWQGIQVRPTAGTPLATGNIVPSGTSGIGTFAASAGTLTEVAGAVSATVSTVAANPTSLPADNTTASTVTVTLRDKFGNPVSGKTVTLAAGSGSSTISAASGPSDVNGVVTFTVKDSVPESVTYTAKDTTDNITITPTATVTFTAVTPGVASFNAVEPGANAVTGKIFTKIAGQNFALDIVALNASNTIATTFTGTVAVEVVDNSSGGACSGLPLIAAFTNQTFVAGDNGRHPLSSPNTVSNVWTNAKVRIKYPTGSPTVITCSGDNFAIRPNTFNVSVTDSDWQTAGTTRTLNNIVAASTTPIHKAGQPFTLQATAVNAAALTTTNYTGTPSAVLSACGGTACTATFGTFSTGTGTAVAGVINSTTATYSEVGAFALQLQDQTFASVDAADGTTADCAGQYVCSTAMNVGRFVPDHFDTAIVAASGVPMPCPTGLTCPALYNGFVYSGQSFTTNVIARNLAGATTTNYDSGTGLSKNVTLTAWDALGSTTTQNPPAATPGSISSGGTIASTSFSGGTTVSPGTPGTPIYTFGTSPTSPTDIYIRATDTDGVTSLRVPANTSVEGGIKVVSGRIKVSNAYGSELSPLTLTATAQYFASATTGWINSATDSVSNLTLAANYNVVKNGITTGTTAASKSPASGLSAGNLTITLAKPTGGATGTATISPTAPSYLPVTPGTATFGVYKSNNSFIYRRESY